MPGIFQLRVAYNIGGTQDFYKLSVSADLAHEFRNGGHGFGTITMNISPADPADEPWETVFDLQIEEATTLRDALTLFIEYLRRNPTPAPD
jgi:dihydrodipicolinate synthase/N-acetylneuraminate lyase